MELPCRIHTDRKRDTTQHVESCIAECRVCYHGIYLHLAGVLLGLAGRARETCFAHKLKFRNL